jgi:hypothetical protein
MYTRNQVQTKAATFATGDTASRAVSAACGLLLLGSLLALLLRTGAGAG